MLHDLSQIDFYDVSEKELAFRINQNVVHELDRIWSDEILNKSFIFYNVSYKNINNVIRRAKSLSPRLGRIEQIILKYIGYSIIDCKDKHKHIPYLSFTELAKINKTSKQEIARAAHNLEKVGITFIYLPIQVLNPNKKKNNPNWSEWVPVPIPIYIVNNTLNEFFECSGPVIFSTQPVIFSTQPVIFSDFILSFFQSGFDKLHPYIFYANVLLNILYNIFIRTKKKTLSSYENGIADSIASQIANAIQEEVRRQKTVRHETLKNHVKQESPFVTDKKSYSFEEEKKFCFVKEELNPLLKKENKLLALNIKSSCSQQEEKIPLLVKNKTFDSCSEIGLSDNFLDLKESISETETNFASKTRFDPLEERHILKKNKEGALLNNTFVTNKKSCSFVKNKKLCSAKELREERGRAVRYNLQKEIPLKEKSVRFKLMKKEKEVQYSDYNLFPGYLENRRNIDIYKNLRDMFDVCILENIKPKKEETLEIIKLWNSIGYERFRRYRENTNSKSFDEICIAVSSILGTSPNLEISDFRRSFEHFKLLSQNHGQLAFSKKFDLIFFLCHKKWLEACLKENMSSVWQKCLSDRKLEFQKTYDKVTKYFNEYFCNGDIKILEGFIAKHFNDFVIFTDKMVKDHKTKNMCKMTIDQYIESYFEFVKENALTGDWMKVLRVKYILFDPDIRASYILDMRNDPTTINFYYDKKKSENS